MKFYMSREGREIYEVLLKEWKNDGLEIKESLETRLHAEHLTLRFSVPYAIALLKREKNRTRTVMRDYPNNFLIREYADGYAYLTEQYVTRDFPRIDLLKTAPILKAYDVAAIAKVANRCKKLNHFTIPYLAGAMEQEGGAAIEELRREQRLDQRISLSTLLQLPSIRAKEGEMRRKIDELAQDRRIDRFLSGENEEIPKP